MCIRDSYLMVSRIKFRSFKDLRLNRRTIEMAILLIACWVLVALNGVDKALIFLVLITAYILLGLAETLLIMRRQFVSKRREKNQPPDDLGDDDVLRELGAFDP